MVIFKKYKHHVVWIGREDNYLNNRFTKIHLLSKIQQIDSII